jgi:hypothetical protein
MLVRASELDDRHHVQRVVEFPVAAAGEPVPHGVTGRHLDRSGPVEETN